MTDKLTKEENEMIDSFYDQYLSIDHNKKIIIPPPEILIANKKTILKNGYTICNKIDRDYTLLQNFLKTETGSNITISENKEMLICNILRYPQIESLIKKFLIAYVQCPQCKYLGTILTKKIGKYFLTCNNCKASCSVTYQ